jgi:predicted amino acid dehydrogenase
MPDPGLQQRVQDMVNDSRFGTISIVGGTGALGGGLARRWARAGIPVIIGSRDAARAEAAAVDLRAAFPGATVRGLSNLEAARAGDVVVLTVPFSHQRPTLEEIRAGLPARSSSTPPCHWCRPGLPRCNSRPKAVRR